MSTKRYDSIIEAVRAWATEDPSVRAAMIVGSQARTVEPADEWSDLDLVIFHTDPEKLLRSTDWFARFGTVVLSFIEPTAVLGSRERRVLYSDGRDVDFAVFPPSALGYIGQSPEGAGVIGRGYRIVLDKDGTLAPLRGIPPAQASGRSGLPSEEEFQACVADFWYHVLWTAKKLRRGELWTAKMACDGYLKQLLGRVIEWETRVTSKGGVDAWHQGRYMDRWASSNVRSRLPSVFSRYDRMDVARALHETGELFSVEAREIAKGLGWVYPGSVESAVVRLTGETLNGMGTAR